MEAAANSSHAPEGPGVPSPAGPRRQEARKILVLDDEPRLLALYKRVLGGLPSRPEIRLVDDPAQALAVLDAEPFDLFITDLRMPKIDGFQVLLSARRRLPDLKTVVISGMANEQYRARAYESGIDLFMEKPTNPADFRIFCDCVESLLSKGERNGGFRGIQSKSLMDLVQFECLSGKTGVLKIISGALEGLVWIENGHVIDAEAQDLRGEEAFRHIFGWKAGNFEIMPGEPGRERTIFSSCEGLLLESAQDLDQAEAVKGMESSAATRDLTPLATVRGVESLLLMSDDGEYTARDLDEALRYPFAAWTHRVLRDFQGVGDILKAGTLMGVQAAARERGLVLLPCGKWRLMAGLDRKMTVKFLRKAGRELASYLTSGQEIPTAAATQFPSGNFTLSPEGKVMDSTLPLSFPRVFTEITGKVIYSMLGAAKSLDCHITELAADFPGLEIKARVSEGGAIVFISPQEY